MKDTCWPLTLTLTYRASVSRSRTLGVNQIRLRWQRVGLITTSPRCNSHSLIWRKPFLTSQLLGRHRQRGYLVDNQRANHGLTAGGSDKPRPLLCTSPSVISCHTCVCVCVCVWVCVCTHISLQVNILIFINVIRILVQKLKSSAMAGNHDTAHYM